MPYPLNTSRLTLSPLTADDAAAFVTYRQDPDVARWQGWDISYSAANAAELIASQPSSEIPEAGGWLQLAIRDNTTGAMCGDVAIHTLDEYDDTFELGITLAPTSQHRGIAHEAFERVLLHLFTEAEAHRVTATCDSRNTPVAKLLVSVGMRKESSQIDIEFFKGEWITLDGYALLEAEHAARN